MAFDLIFHNTNPINGIKPRDLIDYKFLIAEEELKLDRGSIESILQAKREPEKNL